MKKSLAHLPKHKRDELKLITEKICEVAKEAEMIILFGSYARDDWVDKDLTFDGHNTYEYSSDFDILIVVSTNKIANYTKHWYSVKKKIRDLPLRTRATIIVNDIHYINRCLKRSQYFFTDIKKEGILLYDSKHFKLERRRKLNLGERGEIAQKDFKQWFKSAKDFYSMYEDALKKRKYKIAAFLLHQATESLYGALMLVFSNYKPKNHDLEELKHITGSYDHQLLGVFPNATDEQKRCFDLLNEAYVKARYDPDYKITKQQLEYLAGRVRKLQRLTKKICKEKIDSFT